jgi:uncharacterized membrane protein
MSAEADPPVTGQSAQSGQTSQADASHGREEITTERLIFFSDAVVAIAITLLAFALPVPTGSHADSMLRSFSHHESAYLAFVISFLVIGSHWRSHHRLFRSVERLDPAVTTLNMTWLFLIIIQPFATRVLGGNGYFPLSFSFYAVIQVATLLCFLQMSRLMRRLRATPDATDNDLRLFTFVALFAVSIPLSFVTTWAYLCWLAAPFISKAEDRWLSRREAGKSQDEG